MKPCPLRASQTSEEKDQDVHELLLHGSRNFRRYRVRATFAFALLVIGNIGAFFYFEDKVLESRRDVLTRTCEESNRRHDRAIRTLDARIAGIEDPAMRKRAEEGRAYTASLIDSISPKVEDCRVRATRIVR